MKTLEPTEIYLLTLNVVIVIIYSIFSPGFVFWQDDKITNKPTGQAFRHANKKKTCKTKKYIKRLYKKLCVDLVYVYIRF
ncbi:unnamed protein product [Tenebrio molitor]|nr:unnamed protein product [Tenebrio molitor]